MQQLRILLVLVSVLFVCDATDFKVSGRALNSPAKIGRPLQLQCTIPTDTSTKMNFRWAVNGEFKKADDSNQTQSNFTIDEFSEDYLIQWNVKCFYDEKLYTFNATFFQRVFLYIPEESSLTYIYIPGINSVRFEVNFTKIYPLPSCSLFGKNMSAEFTIKGPFYSGICSSEWPLKFFRCLDLQPECYLNSVHIPNGPVKTDCHEALTQSYWDVSWSVLYPLLAVVILLLVKKFYSGEGSKDELDWSMTTKIQYMSAFSALFGNPFLYGYNMAVLNNPAVIIALCVMKGHEDISEMDINKEFDENMNFNLLWSLGVVLCVFFGFIGVLVASKFATDFGRRKPLIWNCVVMLVGSALGFSIMHVQETNCRILLFYLHRSVIGFSCGFGLVVSGMYTMEISRLTVNSVKGSFGTYDRWFHFYITGGIVVATLLGTSPIFGNMERWHWLLFLNCIPALFNLLLFWCPESPIYVYITTKSHDLMRKELEKIFKGSELAEKIEWVKTEAKNMDDLQFSSVLKLMTSNTTRVKLVIVCFLQAAQQLSGINVLIAFSSFVYQYAGVQFELAEWIVFGTSLMNCISTFITLSSRHKRRALLLWSTLLMSAAFFVQFMTSNLCKGFQGICPFFAITAVALNVVAFSLGLGPIPYIMVQELFEKKDQCAAFTISMAVNGISNLFVLFLFRIIQMYLQSYIYLLYFFIVLGLSLLIYRGVPETIDLQVADIENSQHYKFWRFFLPKENKGTERERESINPK